MGRENRGLWWARNLLCGALLGAGAILPGVSGGVLAVVFGVYRPFMEVLTRPRTALPRYWRLLLPLFVGWCAGFLGFAKGVAAAIDLSVTVTTWLFIGLIAGTVPSLFRQAAAEGRSAAAWRSLGLCALASFGGLFYVDRVLRFTAELTPLWCAFCGVLWGVGVVLPGFSASPIMMALGLYRPMLESMSGLDAPVFAASLPAMGVTVLLLARVMSRLFREYGSVTFHGILGIVIATTLAIIPTRYAGAGEAALSALCCAGGFLLAFALERLDKRLRPHGGAIEKSG